MIDAQSYLADTTVGISDLIAFRADFRVVALLTSGVRGQGGAFFGVGRAEVASNIISDGARGLSASFLPPGLADFPRDFGCVVFHIEVLF